MANAIPIGPAATTVATPTAMTVANIFTRRTVSAQRPRGERAHASPRARDAFTQIWKHAA